MTASPPPCAHPAGRGGAGLAFDLLLDTEDSALVTLERSSDGGATWAAVPFTVRDRGETTSTDGVVSGGGERHWTQARADLPAGRQVLRWRYTTDGSYLGRGVYVDDVRVAGPGGVLLDGESHPDAFTADGWSLRSR